MSLSHRIAARLDAVARWLRRPSRRERRRLVALAHLAATFPSRAGIIVDAMADGADPSLAMAEVMAAEIAAVRGEAAAMAAGQAAALRRLNDLGNLRQQWAADQLRAMSQ